MLGTEFNEDDLIIALENIETNNLGDFVKLVKTNSDQVFNLDQNDQTYFFSMCNPPFYDTEESIRDREEYKVQCDIFQLKFLIFLSFCFFKNKFFRIYIFQTTRFFNHS